MKKQTTKARTRHARYKVGTCKLTVTVENEDKVKLHRKAVRLDKKDDSWSVTDKNDENCKRIAHGETLRGAVRLLQKILLGGKAVQG